ncbi:MAG: hypothetical protein OJF50_006445 [Nitrospira sp.]|jgi:SNF family Na+-dependent transporter|nr:hypothetical protein [Nitrospira sp.]
MDVLVGVEVISHLHPVAANLFEYLDPLTYMDEETYRRLWLTAFNAVFHGTMARIGAAVCLFYSFWYGTYKQKFGLGLMFLVFTTCFAYLGSVARLLGIGEE